MTEASRSGNGIFKSGCLPWKWRAERSPPPLLSLQLATNHASALVCSAEEVFQPCLQAHKIWFEVSCWLNLSNNFITFATLRASCMQMRLNDVTYPDVLLVISQLMIGQDGSLPYVQGSYWIKPTLRPQQQSCVGYFLKWRFPGVKKPQSVSHRSCPHPHSATLLQLSWGRWRMGGFKKKLKKKKKTVSWFGPRVLNDTRKLLAMQNYNAIKVFTDLPAQMAQALKKF